MIYRNHMVKIMVVSYIILLFQGANTIVYSQDSIHGAGENYPRKEIIRIVNEVQRQYAPDRRIQVFDIQVEKRGSSIFLFGEIGSTDVRAKLLETLLKSGVTHIQDSLVLLPDAASTEKPFGVATVSVSPMRAKPSESAEMVSQVLMGYGVRVLKKKKGWIYVQSLEDNYIGWMEESQLVQQTPEEYERWIQSPLVITSAYVALVVAQPNDSAQTICDVTSGVLLQYKDNSAAWYSVLLPDRRVGFLSKKSAMEYKKWQASRHPTAETIEATAKQFLGFPYLWGGVSAKGFDCSGFTKIVFKLNGINLSRDADQQGVLGIAVLLDSNLVQLQKGDLLFFGEKRTQNHPERITHVGIYLANNEFIHCSGMVKINSFDPNAPKYSEYLLSRLVKARRLLKEK
jgi:cell wall-associated NlpC family hydrolase